MPLFKKRLFEEKSKLETDSKNYIEFEPRVSPYIKKGLEFIDQQCLECFKEISTPPPIFKDDFPRPLTNINQKKSIKVIAGPLPDSDDPEAGQKRRLSIGKAILAFSALNKPIAYTLIMDCGQLSILWHLVNTEKDNDNDNDLKIISSNLYAAYPGLQTIEFPSSINMEDWEWGLLTGHPRREFISFSPGEQPIDSLLRTLTLPKNKWALQCILNPLPQNDAIEHRNDLQEELALVERLAELSVSAPATGGQAFGQIQGKIHSSSLKIYQKALLSEIERANEGVTEGLWAVRVFLLAEDTSILNLLSKIAIGAFGGPDSLPVPITFIQKTNNVQKEFSIPNLNDDILLSTRDISMITVLPTTDRPGFCLKPVASFGTNLLQEEKDKKIEIGHVIADGIVTKVPVSFPLNDLCKHTLVAGITGSGKTNTVKVILENLLNNKIPFLVIEPVKREYRLMRNDVYVFTAGNSAENPLLLNPLEVMPGVPVQVHVDLLKAAFNAAFALFAPLPFILETCLIKTYNKKGWDLSSGKQINTNNRQPTLEDLYETAMEHVNNLEYGSEIKSNIKGALDTRLTSLRRGNKGEMFNVTESIPMELLLKNNCIIEMQDIGDEEEKSFLMALLLIRLFEYRTFAEKKDSRQSSISHVTVIEEAHRLLAANTQVVSPDFPSSRVKAVEFFANLLAEIRAFGEGFIICEQIPVKLIPDAMKNTNIKITHRLVVEEDRKVAAGYMLLNDKQKDILANLQSGEAVFFSERTPVPILVHVKKLEKQTNDENIRNEMTESLKEICNKVKDNCDVVVPSIVEIARRLL